MCPVSVSQNHLNSPFKHDYYMYLIYLLKQLTPVLGRFRRKLETRT